MTTTSAFIGALACAGLMGIRIAIDPNSVGTSGERTAVIVGVFVVSFVGLLLL